jgi:hypothetical protein
VNVETTSTAVEPVVPPEVSGRNETLRYTSDSYQKILDYHVGEILLTTIIFAVVLFIRLHHQN